MRTPFYTPSPHRTLLSLTGPDVRDFLQGIITNDIRKVTPERAIYAALLSPQGKFLHDFTIVQWKSALLLECETARKDNLLQRLRMYKLRSKVEMEDVSDRLCVIAAYGGNALEQLGLEHVPGHAVPHAHGVCFTDPRQAGLGARCFVARAHNALFSRSSGFAGTSFETYEQLRFEVGVPDGSRDFIVDRSLPLELGMDVLNGVDFAKGCYVGQEVTARSRYRGNVRKALYKVRAEAGVLPAAGTPVLAGGKEIGVLRSSAGNMGLAILRQDAVKEGSALTTEGMLLDVNVPEWK
mgnify:CR=1 FL=1